jgi:hypothetical protein
MKKIDVGNGKLNQNRKASLKKTDIVNGKLNQKTGIEISGVINESIKERKLKNLPRRQTKMHSCS